jgi:hypothetical protein
MQVASLDARAHDKLFRLPPAYKQLVNLIRLGYPDEQCAAELAGHKMYFHPTQKVSIDQAVITVASILGVSEGTYEERREGVRVLGIDFFGAPGTVQSAPKRHGTDAPLRREGAALSSALPSASELAERIAALTPQEKKRLYVGIDESLTLNERAKKLNLAKSSVSIALSKIYSTLDIKTRKGVLDHPSRVKLIRESLALLSVSS